MRRRLIVIAALTTGVVLVVSLIPLGWAIGALAERSGVAAAERDAQLFARLLAASGGGVEALAEVGVTILGATLTIVFPDGSQVGDVVAVDGELDRAWQGQAFTIRSAEGAVSYVPVFNGGEPAAVVRVGVPAESLRRGVVEAWAVLAVTGVVLLGTALVMADRFGRSLVGAATDLSEAAGRIGRGDLSVRVPERGPDELAEAAAAMNKLADRVRQLLQQEREAVADLSHRLRTPLTVLRLDMESSEGSNHVLASDLDELELAVDSLIREARRPYEAATTQRTDLAEVTRDRTQFWQALARDQNRQWTADLPPGPLMVSVSEADLVAVVDALLDNVFTHTPQGTPYTVRSFRGSEGMVRLVVEDRGPGFAGDSQSRAQAGSTGLGLDIVERTAMSAGGGLLVTDRPRGGARVEVWFSSDETT